MQIHLRCNAKINLFLRVLARRQDGYHDIQTLYHSISLSDAVSIEKSRGGIEIICDNSDVPCDQSNLAAKAASLLLEGRDQGVVIRIAKEIPVGAGLGGGSANAAATLVGINRLFGLGMDQESLDKIATKIGSDVRFLLHGGFAVGEGRGDLLRFLRPLPALTVLLVKPPFMISSEWAYKALDRLLTRSGPSLNMALESLQRDGIEAFTRILHNDLELVVFERYPIVKAIKEAHIEKGAIGALMSGSGPTVFGIYGDTETASKSKGFFEEMGLWTSCVTLAQRGISLTRENWTS